GYTYTYDDETTPNGYTYTYDNETIPNGYNYTYDNETIPNGYTYTYDNETIPNGYNYTYDNETIPNGYNYTYTYGTTYINPPTYYYTQPISYTTTGTTYTNLPTYYHYTQPTYTTTGTNYVNPPIYYYQSDYHQPSPQIIPNQVLSYTDIKTEPKLDSVYLSDIPNTGFENYFGTIIFICLLMSWSAVLAYLFLKRKIETQIVFITENADERGFETQMNTNNAGTNDLINSNFINQITSDNSDISKVEEYARINKILFSSDAIMKLIKLSRLGQINVSEYIRSIATGEWIAMGEEQIISPVN
ncbi:MAG: hypothetical protein ABH971_02495, partial [bacterium]